MAYTHSHTHKNIYVQRDCLCLHGCVKVFLFFIPGRELMACKSVFRIARFWTRWRRIECADGDLIERTSIGIKILKWTFRAFPLYLFLYLDSGWWQMRWFSMHVTQHRKICFLRIFSVTFLVFHRIILTFVHEYSSRVVSYSYRFRTDFHRIIAWFVGWVRYLHLSRYLFGSFRALVEAH